MGAERRSTYIDPKAKKLTAYHEVRYPKYKLGGIDHCCSQGGHALVALYTEGAMPLHKVTCMPRGNALGYVSARALASYPFFIHTPTPSPFRPPSFRKTIDIPCRSRSLWQRWMSA